jgi:putative ATP-dependent endonuclease of the OLD family
MRLHRIRIKNFRSFWSDGNEQSVDVMLRPGVNYFAGPNNAGKSNLFRAVELALNPDEAPYRPEVDQPNAKQAHPTVTLAFRAPGSASGPVRFT